MTPIYSSDACRGSKWLEKKESARFQDDDIQQKGEAESLSAGVRQRESPTPSPRHCFAAYRNESYFKLQLLNSMSSVVKSRPTVKKGLWAKPRKCAAACRTSEGRARARQKPPECGTPRHKLVYSGSVFGTCRYEELARRG